MRILIADDEKDIVKALKAVLERSKYTVEEAYNGTDAEALASQGGFDLIILDIMMPGKDGLTLVKDLRKSGISTPILLLTALGSLGDKVTGLDAGADDYLPKPFEISELLARVRALLRRRESYEQEVLTFGDMQLNCGSYELSGPEGTSRLANKEFQIIEYFMRNPHMVFSTDHLMERFWGWSGDTEINVVWTNIAYLRRKLKDIGAHTEIRSIRGAGYKLEEKK